jgi:hypothetical protein
MGIIGRCTLAAQICIHGCLNKFFRAWGRLIAKRTCCVFTLSLICIVIFSSQIFSLYEEYEDQQIVWTPEGN